MAPDNAREFIQALEEFRAAACPPRKGLQKPGAWPSSFFANSRCNTRATWVLPVPLLPTAMPFSRRWMYSQRASSIRNRFLTTPTDNFACHLN